MIRTARYISIVCVALGVALVGLCIAEETSVLFLVAPTRTHPGEYATPRKALEAKGFRVVVACARTSASDMNGRPIPVDLTLDTVDPRRYRAVVVVGGYSIWKYAGNPAVERILMGVDEAKGLTAGICAGTYVLGKAGLLRGKKATGPKPGARWKKYRAEYTGRPVEVDGRVITGKGPSAAEGFGNALVQLLSGRFTNLY